MMILVLLGDGVANVVLNKTKGLKQRLDRHHRGLGVAVAMAVGVVGRL